MDYYSQTQTTQSSNFLSDFFASYGISAILILIGLILITGLTIGLILYFKQKKKLPRAIDQVLLSVKVRRQAIDEDAERQDPKELISVMEPFLANLASIQYSGKEGMIYGKESISLEIASLEGKISFYITVPKHLQSLVEKQINAQYSDAVIERVSQYNIFTPDCDTQAVVLTQVKNKIFPIKTYQKIESDPLNNITNALSKMGKDENAAVQVMLVPDKGKWRDQAKEVAKNLSEGKGAKPGSSKFFKKSSGFFTGVLNLGAMFYRSVVHSGQEGATDFITGQKEEDMGPEQRLTPMEEEVFEGLGMKSSKIDFRTVVRIITTAQDQTQSKANLGAILGAFTQFNSPNLNGFKPVESVFFKKRLEKNILRDYIFRFFPKSKRQEMILNTEEISSIYHFPNRNLDTPHIEWLEAKKSPPPSNLSAEGLVLGESEYRGVKEKVRLATKDRSRHLYMIGRTGTGKSVFLGNSAIQDIRAGKGVCVIDPHGDLVDKILEYIPEDRIDDVVIFDPSDTERPLGLNMLDFDDESQKDFVVGEMLSIFQKLYAEFLGPRFDHIVRNAFLTIMADPASGSTLLELPRIITDTAFQKLKLSKLKDPVVQAFWDQEMSQTSDFHKSEMLGPVISKIGAFMTNEMMRNIIGQQKSTFNIQEIMDKGKILLVKLSKGKVGELNMKLLGLIIVAKIQMGAMARAAIPEDKRRNFYLYVDEFQNFATDSFESILSEARKYALNLTIAHQYIAQIENAGEMHGTQAKLREAVFGNVGTIMCGRIGPEDAEIMERVFKPTFDQSDLLNIDKFHANTVLSIDNVSSKPFDVKLNYWPENPNPKMPEIVKQASRMRFGRDKAAIETNIVQRMQLGKPAPQPRVSQARPSLRPRPQVPARPQMPASPLRAPASQPLTQPRPQVRPRVPQKSVLDEDQK